MPKRKVNFTQVVTKEAAIKMNQFDSSMIALAVCDDGLGEYFAPIETKLSPIYYCVVSL